MRNWIGIGVVIAVLGCGGGGPPPPADGGGPPACSYPTASGSIRVGDVLPPLAWSGALNAEGQPIDFSVEDFHCSPEYSQYDSMILLVSAGWCSQCPAYIAMLNGMAASLEAQGTLLVYLEMETPSFVPATSQDAAAFIASSISPSEFAGGLRIGQADMTLEEDLLRPNVHSFPSAYFIRRRDMSIVADQSASVYVVDWASLAANPDQTWTPAAPTFVSHCVAGDEEASEPNDTFGDAQALGPDVDVDGAVCAITSDFYRIDLAGAWRFDLYQSLLTMADPQLYDANLRLWNMQMERIGGSDVRGNHDWVDYTGPAWVEVYGEQNASGIYRVRLTAR